MRKITRAVFVRVAVIAAVALAGAICLLGPVLPWAFEAVSLRTRILCKTDHQALLSACQELTEQVRNGKLKAGSYQVRPWADPAVSGFPKAIRDLGPASVYIDGDGRVMVEMFGGLTGFGVYAYTENHKTPFDGFKYGDRELIPNLWYYDDDYQRNPEFDKVVEALVNKRRK